MLDRIRLGYHQLLERVLVAEGKFPGASYRRDPARSHCGKPHDVRRERVAAKLNL